MSMKLPDAARTRNIHERGTDAFRICRCWKRPKNRSDRDRISERNNAVVFARVLTESSGAELRMSKLSAAVGRRNIQEGRQMQLGCGRRGRTATAQVAEPNNAAVLPTLHSRNSSSDEEDRREPSLATVPHILMLHVETRRRNPYALRGATVQKAGDSRT
jgi:hypothetical protein